jgi:hypothetical protein
MMGSTLVAMFINLAHMRDPLLLVVGSILMLLGIGILIESARAVVRPR